MFPPQVFPPQAPCPSHRILGVEIAALNEGEALAALEARRAGHAKIAFANAHLINLACADAGLCALLANFLVLPDGAGVDLAAKLLHGAPFPANLNGTDFVPRFLAGAPSPLRVMLLGARPGVAEKAAAALSAAHPRHAVQVLSHGYFSPQEEGALLAQLAAAPPDVLLVAMGNPAQEKWIARCITPAHAHLALGVGALFDFLSGEVVRAPAGVRALRLEWAWRLLKEPGRLWRRYILGNPLFVLRVLRAKLAG